MIEKYSLHYSYKNIGDVLIVVIESELECTRSERKGQIEILFNEDKVIGYNIFDISEIIKIKNNGPIFLPEPTALNILNNLLENAGVERLASLSSSGYYVGKVLDVIEISEDKTYVMVDIAHDMVSTIIKNAYLEAGEMVVVATAGTRLGDGSTVKLGNMDGTLLNGHICTELELSISDKEKVLKLKNNEEIGKDFFTLEN